MASDSDEREFISIHKPTGSWICEHVGEVHAISFAIPVEQEEQHGIGFKISDPTKAGVHYFFVVAPRNPETNWEKDSEGKTFGVFRLAKINKTRAAKKVEVTLRQTSTEYIQVPHGVLPTPAPKEVYTKDPAVVVTKTFPRMTIDVKVSDKALPQQTFAYPALFRIDAPTFGKPSVKLLWGRYDPENQAFNHVLRPKPQNEEPFDKAIERYSEPFTTLTEAGKRDKFAQQFNLNFTLTLNSIRKSSESQHNSRFAKDPVIFQKVIQLDSDIALYKRLTSVYFTALEKAGQKVAGRDFFRKTFLHFISEHIEQA